MINSLKITILVFIITSCSSSFDNKSKPKNLILLIGDGMGPAQISLLQAFLKNTEISEMKDVDFAFEKMSQTSLGLSTTHPHGNIVVDSACSASQLAIGQESRPEMIGLDFNGNSVKTILEKAKEKGLATGLVTDTRITHATPAAFAAHVAKRWDEDTIATEYIRSSPDVLLSGGANRFVPQNFNKKVAKHLTISSKRKDNRDLLAEAADNNYHIIHTKNDLDTIPDDKKLLGLFTNSSMPSSIWYKNNKDKEIPTLLEMTKTAINKLSKNEKGFFLMVEAGQIDWAGHQNDAGSLLNEMLTLNSTLNWLSNWVKNNNETLLVVTADHETGGFGLSYNIHNLPKAKKLSGSKFLSKNFKPNYNYGNYKNLDKMYLQKKTFRDIWTEFKSLNIKKQNPKNLKSLIDKYTGFTISLERAKAVLKTEPNRFKNKNHYNLKVDHLPLIHDFREYYVDTPNVISALIGRGIAAQQNVIWGTGGHTSVPVSVYSLGSKNSFTKPYSGQMSHPLLGKKLQDSLNLN